MSAIHVVSVQLIEIERKGETHSLFTVAEEKALLWVKI